MALNKRGICELATMLVNSREMYNQNTFGSKHPCGTVCCMAGLCYVKQVGIEAFNTLLSEKNGNISDECLEAGIKLLGIESDSDFPLLFGMPGVWSGDLRDEYYQAETGRDRVIVALKALQRLQEDGSIDPNPNAIHTHIPQLQKLLKERRCNNTLADT